MQSPSGLQVGTPRPLPPPLLSSGAGWPGCTRGRASRGSGPLVVCPAALVAHRLRPHWEPALGTFQTLVCWGASVITPSAHRDPGVGKRPTQHRPLAQLLAPACHALCTGGRDPKHLSGGLLPGGTSSLGVSMRPSPLHRRLPPPPRRPPCPGWPALLGLTVALAVTSLLWPLSR